MIETETRVVVLNEQPEFSTCNNDDVSASYFILCEEDANLPLSKNVQDYKIAGMSILNWVVRVCETQPTILKVNHNDDVLKVIKPYLGDSEYSVVLYASTPLLNRGHIKDLLGFVARKHMNACKLKKGYVFKNEYIENVDEIYSIDTYDFASNDFFEVKNYEDLSYAQEMLQKKVIDYHRKNGVYFENSNLTVVDATTEIGYNSSIAAGVSILSHSTISDGFKAGSNSVVSGSKIGDNVKIGKNVLIEDSVIKNGAVIESDVVIKNSVIGNNVKVSAGVKLISTGVKDDAKIGELSQIVNSRIAENVYVGVCSSVIGDKETSVVMQNSLLGANVKVVDSKLSEATNVPSNSVIISNKKVNE